jgi:hypothetical protein
MAEYYNSGDCIDGNRVLIRFKKILQQPATYIVSPTGFKGTKYKCSRDGDTEIVVTLSPDEAAIASEKKMGVHVSVGDRLKCNKAFFIAETRKKLNCFDVTMMSGRHECSERKPDVRVYAEIETPFESIVHAAERKLIELQKQKELSASNYLSLGK